MINKYIILPLILVGCTAPVTDPPAHACSPRLDGKPTHCPEPDAVCLSLDCPDALIPRQQVKGEIDIYDPYHWNTLHGVYIDNLRKSRIEQTATKPSDAINNAIAEYNYGSNDTTEQEELLQLQSHGD